MPLFRGRERRDWFGGEKGRGQQSAESGVKNRPERSPRWCWGGLGLGKYSSNSDTPSLRGTPHLFQRVFGHEILILRDSQDKTGVRVLFSCTKLYWLPRFLKLHLQRQNQPTKQTKNQNRTKSSLEEQYCGNNGDPNSKTPGFTLALRM